VKTHLVSNVHHERLGGQEWRSRTTVFPQKYQEFEAWY